MEQKTFYRVLVEMERAPHKAPQLFKDQRFTADEKQVLRAQILVHEHKFSQAVELLQKMNPSDLVWVEGHRRLVLGTALNHLHRYHDAEANLKDAAQVMEYLEFSHSRFNAHYQLFTLYSHTADFEQMRMHLGTLRTIPVHTIEEEVRLLRCQFMYHSELMDFGKAEEYLALLKMKKKEMNETERVAFLVHKFRYFVRQDDFDQCREVLDQLKQHKAFRLNEKYKTMKVLLDHLINGKVITAELQGLKKSPMYYHQIKVIQELSRGSKVKAGKHWLELEKLNPSVYSSGFEYRGTKSLFQLCLDQHLQKAVVSSARGGRKKAA